VLTQKSGLLLLPHDSRQGRYVAQLPARFACSSLRFSTFTCQLQLYRSDSICACMQIYRQLTSPELLLPWEEGRISQQDVKKLGKFRRPILKLLQREPSKRDSVMQFCKSMFEIFCSTAGGTAVHKDTMPTRW
jgi:hypothetical protein